jgi:RNA polymerase sigma-70 factor (ECF subfamily)
MIDAADFQKLRPYLFSIAYRMLGSASDAEDVVQDAYLRAAGAELEEVRSMKAYMSTVVTRLSLDRLKSARAVREQYVGPWLPEPVLTVDGDEIERAVERYEGVTIAFLTLLESLSPQERAVFLLREVFDYEHSEIAEMLNLTPANCRQILHRAKTRMEKAKPGSEGPKPRQMDVVERFRTALQAGDAATATGLLAENVTWVADGGGKVPAAKVMLEGRDRVAALLEGLARAGTRLAAEATGHLETAAVNAEPGFLLWVNGRLDTVFVCSVVDDRIERVHAVRNPDKLRHLEARAAESGLR